MNDFAIKQKYRKTIVSLKPLASISIRNNFEVIFAIKINKMHLFLRLDLLKPFFLFLLLRPNAR